MFRCNILLEDVNSVNVNIWKNKLRQLKLNNMQKKVLKRYNVEDVDEYILLISDNINNKDKLKLITDSYNTNKKIDLENERIKEQERITKLLKESVKRKDDTIKLKMITEREQTVAANLYMKFKTIMEEDVSEASEYVEDFILKNIIFGIFEKKVLVGIIIINPEKYFNIDDTSEKVKTFYIQELIIDEKYKNKGYGKLLINYCILRCPHDIQYISFMTMPTNSAMIKIAKNFNFIQQTKPSGDKKHSLLFIRFNDKVERTIHKLLSYNKKTTSSSSF